MTREQRITALVRRAQYRFGWCTMTLLAISHADLCRPQLERLLVCVRAMWRQETAR